MPLTDLKNTFMNQDTLAQFLAQQFPQSQDFATLYEATDERVTLMLQPNDSHLRPGNTISGPVMMALADLVAYVCILNTCEESELSTMALAVTTNLNINFMHRPKADMPLYAHSSLLKMGKRLAVCDVRIEQAADDLAGATLVAHSTCTYALPSVPTPQTSQS